MTTTTQQVDEGELQRQLERYDEAQPLPPVGEPPEDPTSVLGYLPGPIIEALVLAGGLAQLAFEVVYKAIRRPKGYWSLTFEEMFNIVRQATIPLFFSVATFDVMTDILGLNFVSLIGANDRYSEFFEYVSVREFSDWIMAVVIAGIVGSSLCADLGARKVREELDAMRVLGSDPVRELVLPRVVATTLVTPMMLVFTIALGFIVPIFGTQIFGGVPGINFYDNMLDNVNWVLLAAAVFESGIFGFVIGVVSAYKGMNCGSGSIGVGRAVNQSVVLIFVLIFVIDFIFMDIVAGLFPNLTQLR